MPSSLLNSSCRWAGMTTGLTGLTHDSFGDGDEFPAIPPPYYYPRSPTAIERLPRPNGNRHQIFIFPSPNRPCRPPGPRRRAPEESAGGSGGGTARSLLFLNRREV